MIDDVNPVSTLSGAVVFFALRITRLKIPKVITASLIVSRTSIPGISAFTSHTTVIPHLFSRYSRIRKDVVISSVNVKRAAFDNCRTCTSVPTESGPPSFWTRRGCPLHFTPVALDVLVHQVCCVTVTAN